MMTKLNNMSDVIRNIQDYKVVALAALTTDILCGGQPFSPHKLWLLEKVSETLCR